MWLTANGSSDRHRFREPHFGRYQKWSWVLREKCLDWVWLCAKLPWASSAAASGCTSILHRHFRVARVTALCKAWSKSLVGSLKEAATIGGSHTHFSFAWRGGGVGATLAVLCHGPPPCTSNTPWVLQGRFLQQPDCSGIQDCGGCKVWIIWTVPKFLCGSDEVLQGKFCKTKHGFQSESSALPSPREGCSGGHARIGTGLMKQQFHRVYRRDNLSSPLHTTWHVWIQSYRTD